MPSLERITPIPNNICRRKLDDPFGTPNLIYKKVNFSDEHYLIDLHKAIFEGDIAFICNHINDYRAIRGKPLLSDATFYDVELFYKEYVSQHPPDGLLRMTQFINAVINKFSQ